MMPVPMAKTPAGGDPEDRRPSSSSEPTLKSAGMEAASRPTAPTIAETVAAPDGTLAASAETAAGQTVSASQLHSRRVMASTWTSSAGNTSSGLASYAAHRSSISLF